LRKKPLLVEEAMEWLPERWEDIRAILVIAGGAYGLWLARSRVKAANSQASAQTRQAEAQIGQADLARKDHVAELFNRAAGQLKDKKLEVRLAAIFTLGQIRDDFADLSDPAIRLLTVMMTENPINYGNRKVPPDVREIARIIQGRGRQESSK
jgi:hypothetical protein